VTHDGSHRIGDGDSSPINDLVLAFSEALFAELEKAEKRGVSRNDMSIAQVIIAKIILTDPANASNARDVHIDVRGGGFHSSPFN
jgi:hypothetical protein